MRRNIKQALVLFLFAMLIVSNPGSSSSTECVSGQLDLVFVIDTTGSMGDDIENVKASVVDIINQLAARVSDYRLALVTFEDFPYSPYGDAGCGDYMYHDILNFTTSAADITNAVNSLEIKCGADWPESHYSALIHTLDRDALGGWRAGPGVKRAVIIITDAPPHDPEPETSYTLESVRLAASAFSPTATIYPIVVGGDSSAEATMLAVADATGGVMYTASNASEVADNVITAIGTSSCAPIADAGGPYSAYVGQAISFDASASSDPDGSIVTYEWDWNNDGTYDESSASPTASHTWSDVYDGYVGLKVTDNTGLFGMDSALVVVNSPTGPTAEAGGPYTGQIGEAITFDASGSSDPDGSIVSYQWDWNDDGIYDDTTSSPTITHTWDAAFSGTVILKVTDNSGMIATDQATVTVSLSTLKPSLDLSAVVGVLGGRIRVPMTLTNVAGTAIAAVGSDIDFDPLVLHNPVAVIGPAGSAAAKMVDSLLVSTGKFRLGVLGVNTTAIGDGIVAYVDFQVQSDTSKIGTTELKNLPSASDGMGNVVSIEGSGAVISIIPLWGDCNTDGVVSIAEVQAAVSMYLGLRPVSLCADPSGDGVLLINEVQAVVCSYLGRTLLAPVKSDPAVKGAEPGKPFSSAVVKLANAKAKQEGEILVPIVLNPRGLDVAAVSCDITYDPAVLKSTGVIVGPKGSAAGKRVVSRKQAPGVVRVGLFGFNDTKLQGGTVAYAVFKVNKKAALGRTVLVTGASASNPSGEVVPLDTTKQKSTVKINKK